jgi:hypothetical protein
LLAAISTKNKGERWRIGFDHAGDLLEIMYNEIGEHTEAVSKPFITAIERWLSAAA